MNIRSQKNSLTGSICVPGSKSHTIRALLLASLADGISRIKNPLPSAYCLSTAAALPLIGSEVDLNLSPDGEAGSEWTVSGAGKNLHLPTDVVNVGNSGSLLYFLSPIAATFEGFSIFTGDESIRKRPVFHVVDALNQLGAKAACSVPKAKTCPLVIQGPVTKNHVVTAGEVSSQYISGLMMAAILMKGGISIELTNPKETPYLTMTQKWLEKVGVKCEISSDYKKISVEGPVNLKAFDASVPSDWEGVAFPLIAALITDSEITIENVDSSGTQGDDAIVELLKSVGADIDWNKKNQTLTVRGLSKSKDGIGRLTTENLPGGELHANLSGYPDAICAVAAIACFIEGKTVIEDIAVCRRKETDRIKVLKAELTKFGAQIEEGEDFMVIYGHSPILADGKSNPEFKLHGATCDSYADHRVAMALSCMGLGLPKGEITVVTGAECCSVSFPHFYEVMNAIGANFAEC